MTVEGGYYTVTLDHPIQFRTLYTHIPFRRFRTQRQFCYGIERLHQTHTETFSGFQSTPGVVPGIALCCSAVYLCSVWDYRCLMQCMFVEDVCSMGAVVLQGERNDLGMKYIGIEQKL